MVINPLQLRALEPLARRYVWWKTPSESLANPHRLLAHGSDLPPLPQRRFEHTCRLP